MAHSHNYSYDWCLWLARPQSGSSATGGSFMVDEDFDFPCFQLSEIPQWHDNSSPYLFDGPFYGKVLSQKHELTTDDISSCHLHLRMRNPVRLLFINQVLLLKPGSSRSLYKTVSGRLSGSSADYLLDLSFKPRFFGQLVDFEVSPKRLLSRHLVAELQIKLTSEVSSEDLGL